MPALIQRLTAEVAGGSEAEVPETWLWRGRHVKLVDGTTVSMPDTPPNQAEFPQHVAQEPGLGFPIARMVVLISLASGMLCAMAMGPYAGKETGELALFRKLVDQGDYQVQWRRPQRPDWMDETTYQSLPESLTLRQLEVKVHQPGFRVASLTVVTTLTDAQQYPQADIAELYHQRWLVELDIRSIKVTLGLDVLRCKTPHMVANETWTCLLAYNLIRRSMLQAAARSDRSPRQLSFASAVQTIGASWMTLATADDGARLIEIQLDSLAQQLVGNRPNRVEPRAVKRRPKPHKLLTQPRAAARAAMLAGAAE